MAFCLILHILNVTEVGISGQGLQGRLGGSVGEGGCIMPSVWADAPVE